jgi:hypothetical protein
LFSNLWNRFERRLKLILENLAEDCELVYKEAKTVNITEAADRRRKVLEEWEKNEEERSVSQFQTIISWLQVEDSEQEDELDRLYSLQHQSSCAWIFKNNKILSWIRLGREESVVWLKGNPGAGKQRLLLSRNCDNTQTNREECVISDSRPLFEAAISLTYHHSCISITSDATA